MKTDFHHRSLFAFVLAAILLAPACSSTPVSTPTPDTTFIPVTAATAEKAKIAVSTFWPNGMKSAEQKINETLASSGQNVAFVIQPHIQDGRDGDDVFLDQIKLEIAANMPSADAYLLDTDRSGRLFDAGLTMDPTGLISQYAPVYRIKFKELFPQRLAGIPVGIYNKPLWSKTVLLLRQDFVSAGGGVSTVEGLFRFIEETIAKPKKGYTVLAYESDLVAQWALENGYYLLNNCGVDGYLCCGIGDTGNTPIPLEEIPGFADFITALKQLQRSGAMLRPFEPTGDRECIGTVYNLYYFFYANPYAIIPIAKGQFDARLFSPDIPGIIMKPNYVNELAISTLCDKAKAAEIVRFVEWMYANQDNYDSVIYGEEDVDFSIEANRCIPLSDGKPFEGPVLELSKLMNLFYSWPGATKLFNSDYYRLPSAAPSNVEELVADCIGQNRPFPLAEFLATVRGTKLLNVTGEIEAVSKQRNDLLDALIQGDPALFTKESLASGLEAIGKLKNKWLCEQYGVIIKGLVNNWK